MTAKRRCCAIRECVVACLSLINISEPTRPLYKLYAVFCLTKKEKKFVILPRDFTVDDVELTPTLKIKRKPITAHWA